MSGKDQELITFGKSLTSKMLSTPSLNNSNNNSMATIISPRNALNTPPSPQQQSQQQPQQHHNSTPSSPSNTLSLHSITNSVGDDSSLLEMECKLTKPLEFSKLMTFGDKEVKKNLKKESLKEQKKNYKCEKKRMTNELMSTLQDPTIVMISDWLKVRGSLKSWVKLWCVLKPGMLVLYKSPKCSHWVATCLLSSCEVIERPSKKDGFCFKLYHPLDQSIWATKGPRGESLGALTLPLPTSYLIFRTYSEAAGRCWIDALELALHCSSLLIRSMTTKEAHNNEMLSAAMAINTMATSEASAKIITDSYASNMEESDNEKHSKNFENCEIEKQEEIRFETEEESDSEDEKFTLGLEIPAKQNLKEERKREKGEEREGGKGGDSVDKHPTESPYVENVKEELGQSGDACQTEEVEDDDKSIIWSLVKQVRPGMDLSRVTLPTFCLEPRSFLDKLSDYYYHADILSEAVTLDDPYSRMKMVVKWYLSGFYKKPKGLKKPYNPILGEVFRCYWKHPNTSSRTFYIAEQISHHPPVSSFYVTNRQDGFNISGTILAKSKFYGNSLSAILEGVCRLVFLSRGEEYTLTMPYAHCKGILIGTLTMEFGGEVTIQCEKTGYRAELEFKLKPFLGLGEVSNRVSGKIKLSSETLSTLEGHWDSEIFIKEKKSDKTEPFWNPTPETKLKRLKRFTVVPESQSDNESEKLWRHVSDAILKGDQKAATDEKFMLEDEQRKSARERKTLMLDWTPRLFESNSITGQWTYKYADWRPWDPLNDIIQYERDMEISTKTNHLTPIVHTTSITSIEEKPNSQSSSHSRNPSMDCSSRYQRIKIHPGNQQNPPHNTLKEQNGPRDISESSLSPVETKEERKGIKEKKSSKRIQLVLENLKEQQKEIIEKINKIQIHIGRIQNQPINQSTTNQSTTNQSTTNQSITNQSKTNQPINQLLTHRIPDSHVANIFNRNTFLIFLFSFLIQFFFVWLYK